MAHNYDHDAYTGVQYHRMNRAIEEKNLLRYTFDLTVSGDARSMPDLLDLMRVLKMVLPLDADEMEDPESFKFGEVGDFVPFVVSVPVTTGISTEPRIQKPYHPLFGLEGTRYDAYDVLDRVGYYMNRVANDSIARTALFTTLKNGLVDVSVRLLRCDITKDGAESPHFQIFEHHDQP